MGRTLKRVPLDFAWPLKKVWGGYINPYSSQSVNCDACDGTGYSPQAKRFHEEWYGHVAFDPAAYGATPLARDNPRIRAMAERNVNGSPDYYGRSTDAVDREQTRLFRDCFQYHWSHHLIQADVDALLASDRLYDFTRTPRNDEQREIVRKKIEDGGNSWLPESNGYTPTADEVNEWSIGGFGHDSINCYVCIKARCEREGVPYTCAKCDGKASLWPSNEIEALHDEWEPTEPPNGDGYQLWETTSEGSPITPVFATMQALCEYAAANCSTFGMSNFVSAREWREMLDDNFVVHREGNHVFM